MTLEPTPQLDLQKLRAVRDAKEREEGASARKGAFIFAGLIGLSVVGLMSCTSPDRKNDAVVAEPVAEAPVVEDSGYSDTVVIAGAKSAVLRKLVDDPSARFRDVSVVVQSSGSKAVCGEVNSKNRAGGYAGYQHFISAGTDEHTYLEEQMSDFSSAWNAICAR